MIDLHTGNIIDMIDSRTIEDVSCWLKCFPNIKLVSRDGSKAYKKAINNSHPQAIQISDKFHLIKNLVDKVEKEIKSFIPRIMIFKTKKHSKIIDATKENQYSDSFKEKLKLIEIVQKEYKKTPNISEVSRKMNLDKKTVKRYINNYIPSYKRERINALNKHKQEILQMLENKNSIAFIYRELTKKEIKVNYFSTKYYVYKLKSEINKEQNIKQELIIYRRNILKLLYNKGINDLALNSEEKQEIIKILKENKKLQILVDLITNFKIALFSKSKKRFDQWIIRAQLLNIKRINSFVTSILKDYEAVINAVLTQYSNGKIEGKINKLKKIKRDMYGRASFELLKKKFFLAEFQPD